MPPVPPTLKRFLKWWPVAAGLLIFFLIAQEFMMYPGLQNDEVLFAQPLLRQTPVLYQRQVAGVHIPLMLLSYLGALKTWIYQPVFQHWKPSAGSVRWPATLICALTIGIFFQFMRFVHGYRAAVIGALLLATDTNYLLTGVFDWGPVSLQHLLFISVLILVVRYHQSGRLWLLGAAAFCAGLGLWDKALFVWPLSGAVLALLAVFPRQVFGREVLSRIRPPGVAMAVAAFALGSSPLILFNVKSASATFSENGKFTLSGFRQKLEALKLTTNGAITMSFMIGEENAANPRMPETRAERWSAAVHDVLGTHRTNWMPWGILAALALLPFLWNTPARRPMLFALIAFAIGWFEMASTRNAGGSGHHVILLWPLPQMFVAVALAEVGRRFKRPSAWVGALTALILIAGNLINLNQCFYQVWRYGAVGSWTDATYPLSASVAKLPEGVKLFVADWGIENVLSVLSQGRLNLRTVSEPFESKSQSAEQKKVAALLFGEKDAIWLRFRPGQEQFEGIDAREDQSAAELGYRKILMTVFWDRNNRPVLEAIRYEPVLVNTRR